MSPVVVTSGKSAKFPVKHRQPAFFRLRRKMTASSQVFAPLRLCVTFFKFRKFCKFCLNPPFKPPLASRGEIRTINGDETCFGSSGFRIVRGGHRRGYPPLDRRQAVAVHPGRARLPRHLRQIRLRFPIERFNLLGHDGPRIKHGFRKRWLCSFIPVGRDSVEP
jgi:hypothetical protein